MLKDLPYNLLKQNERAYEIMLLRDHYGNTFSDIAKEYKITFSGVVQIYNNIKIKQINLYINHISIALEHESTSQIEKIYSDAFECYKDRTYACAYIEKKYKAVLDEYRAGEPGIRVQFINSIPPFSKKISEKTVARVIEMREDKKASFVAIGKELNITSAKAKHTYYWFYHQKALVLIKALEEKAETFDEKISISKHYFQSYKTSKKLYEELIKATK